MCQLYMWKLEESRRLLGVVVSRRRRVGRIPGSHGPRHNDSPQASHNWQEQLTNGWHSSPRKEPPSSRVEANVILFVPEPASNVCAEYSRELCAGLGSRFTQRQHLHLHEPHPPSLRLAFRLQFGHVLSRHCHCAHSLRLSADISF
jgi:hypothetical protein